MVKQKKQKKQHYGIKEYENAIRAFDYATLIDDEFLGAFMEKAKAFEDEQRQAVARKL